MPSPYPLSMTHQHSILPFIFFHLNSGPDREERWIDPQMSVLLTITHNMLIDDIYVSASQVNGELPFDLFNAPAIKCQNPAFYKQY
jgi:hypothetical protein